MTRFDRGIAGLIKKVGLNGRVVVRKETGELIKTLVRVTPKAQPERIRRDISGKFALAGDVGNSDQGRYSGKLAENGILWYQVDSQYLRGIAPELDKRGASVKELEALSYTITKKGRRKLDFIHPHKRQRVLLYQTVLTKAATVNKLIAQKIKNRGRLAAAWMVAVLFGKIQLTGVGQPPAYIKRNLTHESRGYFQDGTGSENKPSFMIANYGKGIGQRQINFLVRKAVNIRARAMAKNALLFMRGIKQLGDYAN